jgi:hypothetical protein
LLRSSPHPALPQHDPLHPGESANERIKGRAPSGFNIEKLGDLKEKNHSLLEEDVNCPHMLS